MCATKLKVITVTLALGAGLAGWDRLEHRARASQAPRVAPAAEEPKAPAAPRARRAAKLDLTPETFTELHALIRPHDKEWRHLRVEWLTDVVAARKKAAKEDKPIVICYTGGAGYNEPLGTC